MSLFVLAIIEVSFLFCIAHACPSRFSLPLCLNLSPLCVPRHSAISCWFQTHHPGSPVPASLTDLLQRIVQHEEAIMSGIQRALENPPPSVSDASESMEDLEIKQEDQDCQGEGCNEGNCCRGGGKMDTDAPRQPQSRCSSSSDCCFNSGESLNELLQRSVDVVVELGLPQELIQHLQQLRGTDWIWMNYCRFGQGHLARLLRNKIGFDWPLKCEEFTQDCNILKKLDIYYVR